MLSKPVCLVLTCAVALAIGAVDLSAAVLSADSVPPEIAQPALAYANALTAGDRQTAWDLISAQSRSAIDLVEWERAFLKSPPPRKPPVNALLQSLTAGPNPATVIDVLPRTDEALIQVGGAIQITQQIVLLPEPDGWRVDLAASDRLNSLTAAQAFLDALREQSQSKKQGPPGGRTAPMASPSMLRLLFAPYATDYQVQSADVEQDRAQVALVAEVPVNLVLRAVRSGPGWTIDTTRSTLPIDATSPDPLGDAIAATNGIACLEQLRQLATAINAYADASGDMFPDPDHWLDQVRNYLPSPPNLHCPADTEAGISYAMNENLRGKRRSQVGSPATTPLLFESTLHTDNPADGGQSWAMPPRHPMGNIVLYVDGSVRPSFDPPSFQVTRAKPGQRPAGQRPAGGGPPMRIQPRAAR